MYRAYSKILTIGRIWCNETNRSDNSVAIDRASESIVYAVVDEFWDAALEQSLDPYTIFALKFDANPKLTPKKSKSLLVKNFGKGILEEKEIKSILKEFALENADLIKGFSKSEKKKVANLVSSGLKEGTGALEIAEEIAAMKDIDVKKAYYIVSDQLAKLHGKVTEELSRALDIKQFKWVHNGNPKGRPVHIRRHNKIYSWNKLPGEGEKPGEWVNCHCVGTPVFKGEK